MDKDLSEEKLADAIKSVFYGDKTPRRLRIIIYGEDNYAAFQKALHEEFEKKYGKYKNKLDKLK